MDKAMPTAQIGDRAPACYGMYSGRTFYSFEEQYGRPVVMVLVGARAGRSAGLLIDGFISSLHSFLSRSTDLYLIVDDNPVAVLGPDVESLPVRSIDCGDFLSRCGVGPADALVLLLDRNLRIALRSSLTDDVAAACLSCLDRLPVEAPRDMSMPAPALVLPNLISPELCRELIAKFDTSPTIDGAVARIDASGNQCSVVDHAKKQRRDMMIDEGTTTHLHLRDLLLARCASEIAKAFQANITHTDRILVSRYDSTGGFFRRHRDNVADNVAFREFALSLNLNTGEYTGGHLLFPEYNDHRYAPPAGGGIIFSASVLHEAAPVTRGSRYVLLTFLHGEAAEARRRTIAAETFAPARG